MTRLRLALYLAAFAAWTAVMIAGMAAGETRGVRTLIWGALGATVLAAAVGIGHAVAGLLRRWRQGPAWKEIR